MEYNIHLADCNMADVFKSNLDHSMAAYDYQYTENFLVVA